MEVPDNGRETLPIPINGRLKARYSDFGCERTGYSIFLDKHEALSDLLQAEIAASPSLTPACTPHPLAEFRLEFPPGPLDGHIFRNILRKMAQLPA